MLIIAVSPRGNIFQLSASCWLRILHPPSGRIFQPLPDLAYTDSNHTAAEPMGAWEATLRHHVANNKNRMVIVSGNVPCTHQLPPLDLRRSIYAAITLCGQNDRRPHLTGVGNLPEATPAHHVEGATPTIDKTSCMDSKGSGVTGV